MNSMPPENKPSTEELKMFYIKQIQGLQEENRELQKNIDYLMNKSPNLADEQDFLRQACIHLPNVDPNTKDFQFYIKVINAYDDVYAKERDF